MFKTNTLAIDKSPHRDTRDTISKNSSGWPSTEGRMNKLKLMIVSKGAEILTKMDNALKHNTNINRMMNYFIHNKAEFLRRFVTMD